MRLCVLVLLVTVLGCAHEDAPLPPVPPVLEDLSQWSVPELVQPPPLPEPGPVVQTPKPTKAEEVLDYAPGTTFTLTVPMSAPLDLVFGPGEQVRTIVGGDRTPTDQAHAQAPKWDLREGQSGAGEMLRHHVYITASEPKLTMGLVIATTKRSYYITCKSVKTSLVRVVRWRYPTEEAPVVVAKEPGLLPDPMQPKRWHTGYDLLASTPQPPDWLPRYVLDDGKKIYIIFPEITLFETAPMVRMVGPNGPALVNARTYLNVTIVDQLAPRLELRVGIGTTAEIVTIARGHLRTIACGGPSQDVACPVWPAAAQLLAHKGMPVVTPPSVPAPVPTPAPPSPPKHVEVAPAPETLPLTPGEIP